MRPREFPIAKYSLPCEKLVAVTFPRGVLEVGQFEYTVNEGK